jgi:hypothetical protein
MYMTEQYARPTVVRNPENLEDSFRNRFVNGIRIPADVVQHARLTRTIETNGIDGATNITNEEWWIDVKKMVKKVTYKEHCLEIYVAQFTHFEQP